MKILDDGEDSNDVPRNLAIDWLYLSASFVKTLLLTLKAFVRPHGLCGLHLLIVIQDKKF